ncbi:DNA adenine methylase [Candidatus Omnitrophota bacterium]
MPLRMFDSLLPYYGGKRKLCPVIFKQIYRYLPQDKWFSSTFVDAFLGSGAMSLYAKARGFKIIGNDISERSYIAGKALIENNRVKIDQTDIDRLFLPHSNNTHFIEKEFAPDVFLPRHAKFLDNALLNADSYLDKYLLIKYVFALRPFSKFSSPNAFNRPLAEGSFDRIKHTYVNHIKDNLKPSLTILRILKDMINKGIFSNGEENEVFKEDAFDFIDKVAGDVLYLDPPYVNTLSYEQEYEVLDKILDDTQPKSEFSTEEGLMGLDLFLERAERFPLWVISYGSAGGRTQLNEVKQIVAKYRKCEAMEFAYKHCEAVASEDHKSRNKEFLLIGYQAS